MTKIQKAGAIAAWVQASCYIIGFAIFIFFLNPPGFAEPIENVVFLLENKSLILSVMSIIYIFAGLALLVLVLSLHNSLFLGSKFLMQNATAIGVIWVGVVIASGMIFTTGAQNVIEIYANDPQRAATLWIAIGLIQNGLGGGTELLGGVWILTISWVGLRTSHFSKALNYLGLVIGCAGILSVVPTWYIFVEIFGLTQIIWYIWIGAELLRSSK